MIASIFASVVAYISTNIDDIFVLMILLIQAPKGTKGRLIAGHFLGVGILTVVSMLGAFGLQNLPLRYVGILGLVPIGLGIKAWFDQDDEEMDAKAVGLLSMAMITVATVPTTLVCISRCSPAFQGLNGSAQSLCSLS